MQGVFDLLIIGAGPAGLFSAIQAAEFSKRAGRRIRIAVFDKNQDGCAKLLISGSGRCNITHAGEIREFIHHYGDNGGFLKPGLFAFPNTALSRYFAERGIRLMEMETGKLFPASGKSQDVARALLDECRRLGADIVCSTPITGLEVSGTTFIVAAENNTYDAVCVIIAAGGASYPATGSTGDGIRLAASCGQPVTVLRPALTPVIAENFRFGGCAGISLKDVAVSLFRSGHLIRKNRGDVLFTHRGLSGPGILDMSRYMRRKDVINLNLMNRMRDDAFNAELVSLFSQQGRKTLKNVLSIFSVPEGLVRVIIEGCGLKSEMRAAELDKKGRNNLLDSLFGLSFTVASLGGFKEAMATAGGVSLDGVNPKTMESLIVPGLFFAGETLDIDGDTGGYNLQAAFSTAYLAGKAATERLLQSEIS